MCVRGTRKPPYPAHFATGTFREEGAPVCLSTHTFSVLVSPGRGGGGPGLCVFRAFPLFRACVCLLAHSLARVHVAVRPCERSAAHFVSRVFVCLSVRVDVLCRQPFCKSLWKGNYSYPTFVTWVYFRFLTTGLATTHLCCSGPEICFHTTGLLYIRFSYNRKMLSNNKE